MFQISLTNIDERWAPEYLKPYEAVKAQYADTAASPGAVRRGKGTVRPNFASGSASTVVACGTFIRRDGTIVLLYQTAAGAVEQALDPTPNWTDASY